MIKGPRFTKRAAKQIASLFSWGTKDEPAGKYMPMIGWELPLDEKVDPGPALGIYETARVPDEFKVECHGVTLAYNLPDRILHTLHSSVLDFDGTKFVFADSHDQDEA